VRDQFNLSGDFRGALVNINSSLDRVRQSVDAHEGSSAEVAARLKELIDQLSAQLQAVAPEHREAAQALAASTAVAVDAAISAKSKTATIPGKVLASGKTLLHASPVIASTVKNILDVVEKAVTLMK
jgi:hypothetical protein